MLNAVIALGPVVVFLAALSVMDAFRLVPRGAIAGAIAVGAVAAVASLWTNDWLVRGAHVPPVVLRRYVAPVIEEAAKALPIVVLVATARVGFLVDAAVQGFAVGTGFALVENLWYLGSIADTSIGLWVVRGFGTALLQGATTAIVAIVSKALADRQPDRLAAAFVPGWAAAVVIHSTFNHRLLPPVAQTLLLLIALPLIVAAVFERSERATREWVGAGLDLDVQLIELLQSPEFAYTRFGRYLRELRSRMPGRVVVDMFCLLRLELELSAQAKGLLLARKAGLDLPADEELEAALAERRYLHASIGRAGLLALKPLQVTSHRDTWHRHLLRRPRS